MGALELKLVRVPKCNQKMEEIPHQKVSMSLPMRMALSAA